MTPDRGSKPKTNLSVTGELNMAVAAALIDQLQAEEAKNSPSLLRMACPSGDPHSGFMLYDYIRQCVSDLTIHVGGPTGVAGVIVLMATRPRDRFMAPHTVLHLEPLRAQLGNGNTISTFCPRPDAEELRKIELSHGGGTDLGVLFRQAAQVVDVIVEGSKLPREKTESAMTEGKWFVADECVQYGLVGGLLTPS